MKLIDVESQELDDLIYDHTYDRDYKCIMDGIKKLQTVDAVPVVHGRWEMRDLTPYCTECGRPSDYECDGAHAKSLYCPNCGAKMNITA